MRNSIAILLNALWTLLGVCMALIALPKRVSMHRNPYALIFTVRSFWWYEALYGKPNKTKGARGMAMGNVVLLGPKERKNDLEHELVHVEQFEREPLIFPLLSAIERRKHGDMCNRYSKYEVEAYERTKSVYTGETKSLRMAKEYVGKKVH